MATVNDSYNRIDLKRCVDTGAQIILYHGSSRGDAPFISIGMCGEPEIGFIPIEPENEEQWVSAFQARNHLEGK